MTSRRRRACRGGLNADLAGMETGGEHDAIASPLKPGGVSSAAALLSILFTALPAMLNFSRLLSSFGNAATSGPVFVSHSSRNLKLAWAATAELEAGGIRCWFAPRDIRPGEPNYGRAIIEGLSGCRAMVLLLTESSNVSQHVMKEAERAVNRKTPILVVRLDSVPLSRDLEYYVSSAQFLDATEAPPQRHFPAITDRLREILREAPQDSSAKPAGDAEATPAKVSAAARPRERVVTTAKEVPTADVVATTFDGCVSSALHVAPNIPTDKAGPECDWALRTPSERGRDPVALRCHRLRDGDRRIPAHGRRRSLAQCDESGEIPSIHGDLYRRQHGRKLLHHAETPIERRGDRCDRGRFLAERGDLAARRLAAETVCPKRDLIDRHTIH